MYKNIKYIYLYIVNCPANFSGCGQWSDIFYHAIFKAQYSSELCDIMSKHWALEDDPEGLIHTGGKKRKALDQAHEAKYTILAAKKINENKTHSEGMIKILSDIGQLIELKEQDSDYNYLKHVSTFDKNDNIGVLRGLNWIKRNPLKVSEKELLKEKKKPGRKKKNLGI